MDQGGVWQASARFGQHAQRQVESNHLAAELGQEIDVAAWSAAQVQHAALAADMVGKRVELPLQAQVGPSSGELSSRLVIVGDGLCNFGRRFAPVIGLYR